VIIISIHIQNLGHACFLLKSTHGINILTDPYLTGNKFSTVSVQDLPIIDIVVVTHGAFDHMGDAIEIIKNSSAKLFCGPDVALHAYNSGVDREQIVQLVWGTSITYSGIEIRSIEAKHISFFESNGQRITGIPMSFILRMEDGTGIYFSGDTSLFSDLKLFGKLYPVKIGLFGMDGLPGYPYEMSGSEAALAAEWLGVEVVIPMHYPPGSLEPVVFREALATARPTVKVVYLKVGNSYVYRDIGEKSLQKK